MSMHLYIHMAASHESMTGGTDQIGVRAKRSLGPPARPPARLSVRLTVRSKSLRREVSAANLQGLVCCKRGPSALTETFWERL